LNQPIRVLHFQGRMGRGGAETFMMNTYRNIDRNKIQFDFLIYHDFKNTTPYNNEIEKLGGRIFSVPNPKKNIFAYILAVKKLLRDEKFDIVHNQVFFGGGLNLWLASEAGISKRITHSHSIKDGKKSVVLKGVRKTLDKLMFKYGTNFLACSHQAGLALFGKNQSFSVVPNGIDLETYCSNEKTRDESKLKFNISPDTTVIGNIGRLEKEKNHKFLFEVFEEILKKESNCILLIVGEGTLESELKDKVKQINIENKVKFLGVRDDIPKVLNAMDIMVMPSLYEGLPISAIEAQASGVKLVLSTEVPDEIKLSENVNFIGLDDAAEYWAEKILDKPYKNIPSGEIKKYDMKHTARIMQSIYIE